MFILSKIPSGCPSAALCVLCGEKSGTSTPWKLFRGFFHSMEKVIHAMETFFHAMENFFHAVEVPDFLRIPPPKPLPNNDGMMEESNPVNPVKKSPSFPNPVNPEKSCSSCLNPQSKIHFNYESHESLE
jgi:hypothetical protein